MRIVINLALFLIICGLVWVLVSSIREPIAFNAENTLRETAVIDRLKSIRAAQTIFRDVTREGYAPDFDTLIDVLKNGKKMNIIAIGDPDNPDDPNSSYDTTYTDAMILVNECSFKTFSASNSKNSSHGVIMTKISDAVRTS